VSADGVNQRETRVLPGEPVRRPADAGELPLAA
jgi:hypothetical protein